MRRLSRVVRRLSLLLEHLRPLAAPRRRPPEQRTELTSQFVTAAAAQADNAKELDDAPRPAARSWASTSRPSSLAHPGRAASPAGAASRWPKGRSRVASRQQLQAMRQIVSLAEDPAEAATRFRELVHAAIEQFNEGHLGRAVTMFELAEQLVAEKKVKPDVRRARCGSSGHE